MDRVDADKKYYFSDSYFDYFLNSQDFESFILLAEYKNAITAGSLFTVCSKIMQYHLSGTYNEYLKYAPMKLILDEARIIAKQRELKYFHLGGGVGGVNDSLFNFKAEFSHNYKIYQVWRKVVNREAYDMLVSKRFGGKIPDSGFFPLYRL
jgi:lipid II:glycine glycyltransferase (peptidoglycan interpeptide bridge formation enzyme)